MSSESWLTRPRTTLLVSVVAMAGAVAAQDYSVAALFAVATMVSLAFSILGAVRHASGVIAGADQLVEDHRRSQRHSESAKLRSTPTTA